MRVNVVIVTGAANGIGRAFVEHYSGTGDRVVAVDIDDVTSRCTRGIVLFQCGCIQ